MLIEPLLGYKSTWRVLNLLFETPRKPVSRPELFHNTKLGNAPLSKALDRLTRAQIITLEKKGNKEFYYINEHHEYAILLQTLWKKEQHTTRNLPYSVSLIIAEFIRNLSDSITEIEKIFLFGSHAKGTASINSDIDLALIFEKEIKKELEITKTIKKIEQQFHTEIQVHYFTSKGFCEKNKLISEIKNEGIRVG